MVFFYHQFPHVNTATAAYPTAGNSMLQVLIVTKLVKKSSFCMKTEGSLPRLEYYTVAYPESAELNSCSKNRFI